jgi:hypothetical protein
MKHVKRMDEYVYGPGGYLPTGANKKDLLKYKIEELSWLKERLQSQIDKISDENIDKYLEELTIPIKILHEILDKTKDDKKV